MTQSGESFSSAARRHRLSSASTLYDAAKRYRPNLIAERKESGAHRRIPKTVDVTPEQREAAVQAVLSGKSVKAVAEDTGIPGTTLYKWVHKAKLQLSPVESAIRSVQGSDNIPVQDHAQVQDNAVIDVLLASIRAASTQLGTNPEELCDLLKSHLKR
jgi:transposase-like protein